MLKIRLFRVGKKHQPCFKVVLTEKTKGPAGKYIKLLGTVDFLFKKNSFKKEEILYYLSKGAQCSETVHNLLITEKIIEGEKKKKGGKKKKIEGNLPAQAEAKSEK